MQVTIARDELLIALQRVQGIVEKRNTMPTLANVLLEAKSEGLEIVATDLELGMRGFYKAKVKEPGSVTFSARKLYEIARAVTASEIAIAVTDQARVTITAGRSHFNVFGLPGTEFPALPPIERDGLISLPGDGLRQLIQRTLFAVGDHDTRYVLNGVLVTSVHEGDTLVLRFVGTDGHRLAVADQKLETGDRAAAGQELKAIIPKKAAAEMRRLLDEGGDEPSLGVTNNMVIFRKSGLVLTSRLMEGQYPNYQQVMPNASDNTITTSRDDMEGALRRVSVLSQEKTFAVKLTFAAESITLFASHPDLGEAEETIPAQCRGESFAAGFNARYLLDVLGVMDGDQLVMDMAAPLSPCLMIERDTPGLRTVVMPVKV